jgi:hypothetical protein
MLARKTLKHFRIYVCTYTNAHTILLRSRFSRKKSKWGDISEKNGNTVEFMCKVHVHVRIHMHAQSCWGVVLADIEVNETISAKQHIKTWLNVCVQCTRMYVYMYVYVNVRIHMHAQTCWGVILADIEVNETISAKRIETLSNLSQGGARLRTTRSWSTSSCVGIYVC